MNELNLKQRWNAPTPKFWKKVRKFGITAGVIGVALTTAPIALPAAIITVGGYLITAGTLTGILSQLTVDK